MAKVRRPAGGLSLPAMLAFSAANIPIAAVTLALTVHLPRYLASHLGVPLTVVGGAFALVRAIDVPLDPALGIAMDRTRSRLGRYRPWLLAAAPVIMLAVWMLLQASSGVGPGYLTVWLLALYVGYSMLLLSHFAWGAALAPGYAERSRLFGVVVAMGLAGAMAALLVPVAVEALGGSEPEGVRAMLWFVAASAPAAALLVARLTPEPIFAGQGRRLSPRAYLHLLSQRNVLRLLISDLAGTLATGWMSALYLFFFTDFRGFTAAEANLLLLAYIAAGLVGAPSTGWLANRIGKHRALMACAIVFALDLLTQAVLPPGDFMLAAPPMILAGAVAAGLQVTLRAVTADIGDELRLASGRELMGLLYALTTATTKIGGALSIFLTYNLLHQAGYDPLAGAANTADAILGLELIFLAGPVVFMLLAAVCFVGYPLTAERHAEIRRALEERSEGAQG